MVELIGEAVTGFVKQTGMAKGASVAISHCDIGAVGAKAMTVGGIPIFSGGVFKLGSLGLGLGLSSLGPIIFFAAGAATAYGYSEMCKRRSLKRNKRPGRNMGNAGIFRSMFNTVPPPVLKVKKRLFSVLGFSVWR
ncbi:hypothetical protein CCP1ISM_40004 [Azospirillaceae bacterium]